jgi:hypothetical protein
VLAAGAGAEPAWSERRWVVTVVVSGVGVAAAGEEGVELAFER